MKVNYYVVVSTICYSIFLAEVHYYFQTYDQSELLQAKLEILSKTNMIDYVIDIRKMLYPDEDTPEVRFLFNLFTLKSV